MNDEHWVTSQLFGRSPIVFWTTVAIVLFFSLPPLVAAYRAISNRKKLLWFLGFLILPFVFVILFAGIFLEEFLLLKLEFLSDTIWGIPLLLLLVEFISILGYSYTKNYISDKRK